MRTTLALLGLLLSCTPAGAYTYTSHSEPANYLTPPTTVGKFRLLGRGADMIPLWDENFKRLEAGLTGGPTVFTGRPAASATNARTLWFVTDCNNTSTCNAGGGTAHCWTISDGASTWTVTSCDATGGSATCAGAGELACVNGRSGAQTQTGSTNSNFTFYGGAGTGSVFTLSATSNGSPVWGSGVGQGPRLRTLAPTPIMFGEGDMTINGGYAPVNIGSPGQLLILQNGTCSNPAGGYCTQGYPSACPAPNAADPTKCTPYFGGVISWGTGDSGGQIYRYDDNPWYGEAWDGAGFNPTITAGGSGTVRNIGVTTGFIYSLRYRIPTTINMAVIGGRGAYLHHSFDRPSGGHTGSSSGPIDGVDIGHSVDSQGWTLGTLGGVNYSFPAITSGSTVSKAVAITIGDTNLSLLCPGAPFNASCCATSCVAPSTRLAIESLGVDAPSRHNGGLRLGSGTVDPDTILHLTATSAKRGALTIDEDSSNPSAPSSSNQARIYVKNDKFVIQWNDGGTTRYFTLALNTATTPPPWANGTGAP